MNNNGHRAESDDGTIEVEIEDDDDEHFRQIDETDVLKVLTGLVEEMNEKVFESFREHKKLLEHSHEVIDEYNAAKWSHAEEIRAFLKRFSRKLASSHRTAHWNAYQFRKTLRDVLTLYVEVNNRMKLEEKGVIKQDAFIAQIDKNEQEWMSLVENLKNLSTELSDTVPSSSPAVVPSTTNMSKESASEANHIEKPYRPFETELATQVLLVNAAMDTLRAQVPEARKLSRMMRPIKALGRKAVKGLLEETQPKTIDDFIESLPPKQRD